jgi:hypothetical protein
MSQEIELFEFYYVFLKKKDKIYLSLTQKFIGQFNSSDDFQSRVPVTDLIELYLALQETKGMKLSGYCDHSVVSAKKG